MSKYELDPEHYSEGYSFLEDFWLVDNDQKSTPTDLFVAVTQGSVIQAGCKIGVPEGEYGTDGETTSTLDLCSTDALAIDEDGIVVLENGSPVKLTDDERLAGTRGLYDMLTYLLPLAPRVLGMLP